jgi:hypothetical protein
VGEGNSTTFKGRHKAPLDESMKGRKRRPEAGKDKMPRPNRVRGVEVLGI